MRKPTRAQRFLVIRNEVLLHLPRMTREANGAFQLICGPFGIEYRYPGASGIGKDFNLNIWPDARIDCSGYRLLGRKVCNVDWNQYDRVDILGFRSGPWKQKLPDLLRPADNVLFFG